MGGSAVERGRALAKAVKAAMLDLVRQRHSEAHFVITTNAEANAPMLSINRRLGFSVHSKLVTYQTTREALAATLAGAAARCNGRGRVRSPQP